MLGVTNLSYLDIKLSLPIFVYSVNKMDKGACKVTSDWVLFPRKLIVILQDLGLISSPLRKLSQFSSMNPP